MQMKKLGRKQKSKCKTQASSHIPFEESLNQIILSKCQKSMIQLYRLSSYSKIIDNLILSLEKDVRLLTKSNPYFGRLKSLVLNINATKNQKKDQDQNALQIINEAIQFEKKYKVNKIDRARTFLNKSIILLKTARKQKQTETDLAVENLISQALHLIEKQKVQSSTEKFSHKIGEVLLMSFYFHLEQLSNQANFLSQNSISLAKRAYKYAHEALGLHHHITQKLKQIFHQDNSSEKVFLKKKMTTQISVSKMQISYSSSKKVRNMKRKNLIKSSNKYSDFMKVYGYNGEKHQKKKSSLQPVEMQDLEKIQKIYMPEKDRPYLPKIKRRNIHDILLDQSNFSQFLKKLNNSKPVLQSQIQSEPKPEAIEEKSQNQKFTENELYEKNRSKETLVIQKDQSECKLI